MKMKDIAKKLVNSEDFILYIKDLNDEMLRGIVQKGISRVKFVLSFKEGQELIAYIQLPCIFNSAQEFFLNRAKNDIQLEKIDGCWFLIAVGSSQNPSVWLKEAFLNLKRLEECLGLLRHPVAAQYYLSL